MSYLKVKDKDHLYRDTSSEGIVSSDIDGYNRYLEKYRKSYNESKRVKKIEDELNSIRNDIDEIKLLLKEFVNGSK